LISEITAGTCRGTSCRLGAFSWSVVEIGGIWYITIFIKVISPGLSLFFSGIIGFGPFGGYLRQIYYLSASRF